MPQHVIVISRRRSGTHLTIDILVNNFQLYGSNPLVSSLTLDHLSEHVHQKKMRLESLSKEKTRLGRWLAKFVVPLQRGPRYSSVGFRKGKSGDWREHFSAEDMAFFDEGAGDINGKLMNMRSGE